MRYPSFAAVVAATLLLAACSGGNNTASQPSSQASAEPAPAPSAAPAQTGTPAKADDIKPLFGTWGLDPTSCGDQVLKISQTRFDGPGSGCTISGFTDNGDGTFTAAMSCTAKGQTSNERIQMRPIFTPTGEGIDLVYLDRDNLQSQVLRCVGAK